MAFVLSMASAASASHYDLIDVDFVTPEERQALAKASITSTDVLLDKCAKKSDRAAVAKLTGLSAERIDALARTADLLQVRGLGPRMVRLFNAGGITHLRQFLGHEPRALFDKLVQVNDEQHLAGLVPPAEMIESWQEQARSLGQVYEE
jgi:nucleotidyltransferase/DNA polymerase involved in DNA repair